MRVLHVMMRPDAVYRYPIWAVALSLVIAAVIATVLLEIGVRRFVSAEFRNQHNEIATVIFSIIGATYAVLLAFVVILAWDGFNKAKVVSHMNASVTQDVFAAADGFADPTSSRAGLSAASGVLVLVLIIALSNPSRGDFRVSTAPYEYVLTRIN